MLGIPSVSDAAQPTATSAPSSTTAPRTDSSAPDDHGGPGHHGFGFEVFDLGEAAKVLGISEDELKTRLAKGDTLAEIAKDEGVDVQRSSTRSSPRARRRSTTRRRTPRRTSRTASPSS
jgi:hypothetical protein